MATVPIGLLLLGPIAWSALVVASLCPNAQLGATGFPAEALAH
jgi:hypothetical protein